MMTNLYVLITFISAICGLFFLTEMYPERRWGRWSLALFLPMALGFCGWQAIHSQEYFVSNLGVITYPLITAIPVVLFFRCQYHKAVIWQWLYQVTIAIFKLPILAVGGMRRRMRIYEVNYAERTLEECVWNLVIVVVIGIILFWILKRALIGSIKYFLDKYWYILIGGFLLIWMLFTGLYEKDVLPREGDLIDSLLVCLVMVSIFWFIWWFFGLKQEEKRNARMRLAALRREQRLIKKRYEQNVKQMHDLKYEMRCLDQYIANGEYEKAREYLATYTERLGKKEKGVWTGILAIDASIDYYYPEMEAQGIQFLLDVDVHNIPMNETDIMVIFGNLLDNAVEAASKCKEGERRITMKIKNVNEIVCMEISNSSSRMPIKKGEVFVTTKKEKAIHGYGISNVCHTIQKNGGEIYFDYAEDYFKVSIMLQE